MRSLFRVLLADPVRIILACLSWHPGETVASETGATLPQVGRTLMAGATLPQVGGTLVAGATPPQAGETMVVAIGATPPQAGGIRMVGLTAAAANKGSTA